MQRNTLDDKIVPDKQQWDVAVKFMEETLREKLQCQFGFAQNIVSSLLPLHITI
jgi:hypothetical protein